MAVTMAIASGLSLRSMFTIGKGAPAWGKSLGWALIAVSVGYLLLDFAKNYERIEHIASRVCHIEMARSDTGSGIRFRRFDCLVIC